MSKFDKDKDQKMTDKFRHELEEQTVAFQPADWAAMRERLIAAMPLYRRWWYWLPMRYTVLSMALLGLVGGGWWMDRAVSGRSNHALATAKIPKSSPWGRLSPQTAESGQRITDGGNMLRAESIPDQLDKSRSGANPDQLVAEPSRGRNGPGSSLKQLPLPAKSIRDARSPATQKLANGTLPLQKDDITNKNTGLASVQKLANGTLPPMTGKTQAVEYLNLAMARDKTVLLPLLPLKLLALPDTLTPPVMAATPIAELPTLPTDQLSNWRIALSVSPMINLGRIGERTGQWVSTEQTLWIERRVSGKFWIGGGVGFFAYKAPFATKGLPNVPNSNNFDNPPGFQANIVAIALPVGIRWEFWQRGPHSLSLAVGLRNFTYAREKYRYDSPQPVFNSQPANQVNTFAPGRQIYFIDEWTYQPFNRLDWVAQGDIALTYHRSLGKRWAGAVGPHWSFPLRKMTHEALSLHTLGLTLWVSRAGK